MSNHPLVSVVIPAYNTAEYIERCLQSITVQTLHDIEIIVVDDGSTDDTASRIEAHADPRLTLLSKSNGGPSSAKNLGLDRARGEFVLLLDSDDWVEPPYLHDMTSAALAGDLDIIASDAFYDYPGKPPLPWSSSPPSAQWISRESVVRDVLAMRNASWMATRLYRRKLFEEHRLRYDEEIRFSEDRILDLKLFHYARRVGKLDRGYLHYVQRPGSLTNRRDMDFFGDVAAHYRIVDFVTREGLADGFRDELEYLEYRTVFLSLVRASPNDPRHATEYEKIVKHIPHYWRNALAREHMESLAPRTRWLQSIYRLDYRLGCAMRRLLERLRFWRRTRPAGGTPGHLSVAP